MRVLLCIAIALATPTPSEACSCGAFDSVTPASCRGATRVFAGTVAAYHWPNAYENRLGSRWRPVEVELAVDRVWKGEVASSLVTTTGFGGGDCGIHPLPGTRFVVCDDQTDDAPVDFALCAHPAFDDPSLEAALGTPRAPAASVLRPQPLWWRDPLLVPLIAVVVFAMIGRSVRRAPPGTPVGYPALLLAMVACVAGVIVVRATAYIAELPLLAAFGPVGLAVVIGAVLGYVGQRHPHRFAGAFGGLAVAVALAALAVSLGYAPLHLPWKQDAEVACSRRRAEAILDRDEPLEDALARQPYACTDWGTVRYRIAQGCLGFADGDGGEWFVCRTDGVTSTFIGPELPR